MNVTSTSWLPGRHTNAEMCPVAHRGSAQVRRDPSLILALSEPVAPSQLAWARSPLALVASAAAVMFGGWNGGNGRGRPRRTAAPGAGSRKCRLRRARPHKAARALHTTNRPPLDGRTHGRRPPDKIPAK